MLGDGYLSRIVITYNLKRHSEHLLPKYLYDAKVKPKLAIFKTRIRIEKVLSTALHTGKDLAVSPLRLPEKLILYLKKPKDGPILSLGPSLLAPLRLLCVGITHYPSPVPLSRRKNW